VPDLLRREALFVAAVVVAYALPIAIGFARYRLTSYPRGREASAVLVGTSASPLRHPAARIATSCSARRFEEIAITRRFPARERRHVRAAARR
jgi:hypothetical protein